MKRPASRVAATYGTMKLAEMDVRTLRKWLQEVEPEFASTAVTASLDKATLQILFGFMLGWHPEDIPQQSDSKLVFDCCNHLS